MLRDVLSHSTMASTTSPRNYTDDDLAEHPLYLQAGLASLWRFLNGLLLQVQKTQKKCQTMATSAHDSDDDCRYVILMLTVHLSMRSLVHPHSNTFIKINELLSPLSQLSSPANNVTSKFFVYKNYNLQGKLTLFSLLMSM